MVRPLDVQPHHATRAMEPIPNWAQLARGDEVEIQHLGNAITAGKVDMLALDGRVILIFQDEGKGRAMFLANDGLSVFRRR